jgi:predicted dehydrogenase
VYTAAIIGAGRMGGFIDDEIADGSFNKPYSHGAAYASIPEVKLVAVASRTSQRAQQFIDDCQSNAPVPSAPVACGSYQEMLDRADVDAVYIPLPTGIRKEWVIRAAQAGKHVLCEKPCGVNSAEVKDMIDACREKRVQFMDGVMFMHSQRLPMLRQVLDDGHPNYATLDPRQVHGSAYGMVGATRGHLKPTGEWNDQEVTVRGSRITVVLNGTTILDTDLATVTTFMADTPHPGKDRTSGHFGFAGHNDPVAFRNIRIRELP